LQDDLHKLFQWSQDWQMLFSTDKSKMIHFGFNNNVSSYVLGTSTLCTVDKERDLGVIIHKTLKPRTFLCKSKELKVILKAKLYKSLIKHKLEYCIQAWRPCLKRYKYFRKGAKKGNQNDIKV